MRNFRVVSCLLLVIAACAVALTKADFYSCPPVNSDTAGTCNEECSADSACPEQTRCCSNGCGHTCVAPISIPYHIPTLVCPEVAEGTVGTCSEECNNCSSNGELCCFNGCGHVCTPGVASTTPCVTLRDTVMGANLIGAYVPQCEEDGSFSPVQCHASTGHCWCVAAETGVPVTDMVRFGQPQCNCTYEGQVFRAGDFFEAVDNDGCDICSCTIDGGVSCSYRDCVEVENNVFYSCPAVRAGASTDCNADCLLHSDCNNSSLKCCYNGCGYSCMEPHRIPYIDISSTYISKCPNVSSVPCYEDDDDGGSDNGEGDDRDGDRNDSEGDDNDRDGDRNDGDNGEGDDDGDDRDGDRDGDAGDGDNGNGGDNDGNGNGDNDGNGDGNNGDGNGNDGDGDNGDDNDGNGRDSDGSDGDGNDGDGDNGDDGNDNGGDSDRNDGDEDGDGDDHHGGEGDDDSDGDREARSCRNSRNACDEDKLCCESKCGNSVCISRNLDPPCFTAVELTLASNSSSSDFLRTYRPQCTTQGHFRQIQCHSHFCWCVEPDTGIPLSDIVPFEQANVLACAACVYNGLKFRHMESFPSGDGCNTCTCVGGTISCSRIVCEPYIDYNTDTEVWQWWHSVLIGCVVVVVVLVTVVLALLVGIVVLMRQNNPHRHHRLKEPKEASSDECELVEYRNGDECVELKVPMEDTLIPLDDGEPVKA